jgi:hypothetical protein
MALAIEGHCRAGLNAHFDLCAIAYGRVSLRLDGDLCRVIAASGVDIGTSAQLFDEADEPGH